MMAIVSAMKFVLLREKWIIKNPMGVLNVNLALFTAQSTDCNMFALFEHYVRGISALF